jgi:uncharacterized glyoxalase superfamily protein PhnB
MQAVVAAFMTEGHLARHIGRRRSLGQQRRASDRFTLEVQAGGMHLIARGPALEDDRGLAANARAHGRRHAANGPPVLPNIPAEEHVGGCDAPEPCARPPQGGASQRYTLKSSSVPGTCDFRRRLPRMLGSAIMLKTLTPILTTDNMERSVRFYVDVFGFTCGVYGPAYSNLYRDEVRLVLAAPNAHSQWKGPSFTGQLYIVLETADQVDALWARVRTRAEVIYEVQDFDYGAREFAVRDDNGYPIAFGAPSACRTPL